MAKTVFRPNEIKTKSGDKVTLKLIHDYTPEKVEEAAEVEEYIGPTADDLDGTVNYADLYATVEAEMAQPSLLLENVAYRITQAVKKNFPYSR